MKIPKTEKEFRETIRPALRPLGASNTTEREDAVIAALDLEFEEKAEEPELPAELGYLCLAPNRMLLIDGEGKSLGVVVIERRKLPFTEVYELLTRSLGRYNDYPKLETLARKLFSDLKLHHEMREMGECASAPCPTCALLKDAQEKLQ